MRWSMEERATRIVEVERARRSEGASSENPPCPINTLFSWDNSGDIWDNLVHKLPHLWTFTFHPWYFFCSHIKLLCPISN